MNLAVLYVAVPQAVTMGCTDMLFCGFGKTIKSCCWGNEAMRS